MIEHDCWRLEISLPLPSPFGKGGWGIFCTIRHGLRRCPKSLLHLPFPKGDLPRRQSTNGWILLPLHVPLSKRGCRALRAAGDFSHGNQGRGSIQSLLPPSQARLLSAFFSSCKITPVQNRKDK